LRECFETIVKSKARPLDTLRCRESGGSQGTHQSEQSPPP
jgi:hypothetical protein